MLQYIVVAILLLTLYGYYRYSYAPKAQIKRYKALFQKLGYRVYQQPFTFMGLSLVTDFERGKALHKDAQYVHRTVYTEVDVSIGNLLDRVTLDFIELGLIKEIQSAKHVENFPKTAQINQSLKIAFGEGVGFIQGQQWRRKRKLFSKIFNYELLKENIPRMCQMCDKYLDIYDAKYKCGQTIQYNVQKMSTMIFSGVMITCFLGSESLKGQVMGLPYQQFAVKTIGDLSLLTLSPLLTFFGKLAWNLGVTAQIRNAKVQVNLLRAKAVQILSNKMQKLMTQPRRDRITDIIQAIVYQKMDQKQLKYTEQDLVDDFVSFLLAGSDTTAKLYAMMVYYIGKNPHVHKKLREEINTFIKKDQDIVYENLKQITYIDWIQYETTRMYGPANMNFWRTALQDSTVKDIPIRKGTVVNIQPRGNHYNPKYFKDPDTFKPERWESECDNIHPYALGGFGSGPKNCLGKQLSYLQSKIALVKFIRRYETIQVPEQLVMTFISIYEPEPFITTFTPLKTK